MSSPRFFCPQTLCAGAEVELEAGPAAHIARTLRMRPGASIVLFNGRGGEFSAELLVVERRRVRARVGAHCPRECEAPLAVTLAIGMSRGERMDWTVQKATELGVARIVPLSTERSTLRLPPDRLQKRIGHWRGITESACEQCGRNTLPEVSPPTELRSWLEACGGALKLVLDPGASGRALPDAAPADVSLLIGPEGGFSGEELALCERAGFRTLRLGPRILRTETAPVAALSVLQARWGDLRL